MPQVNVTPANFNQAQMTNLLNDAAVRTYLRQTEPTFAGTEDQYGQRYDLTWTNAVTFSDRTRGSIIIHMHERSNNSNRLDGGGAWVEGGAQGNGIQIDGIAAIKRICTDWLNDHYEREGDEAWTC